MRTERTTTSGALPTPSAAPVAPSALTYTSPSGTVYTTPAANEPLRQGHFGEAVKALQLLLNKAGAQLDPDGVFGPKTAAALEKLTGSRVFDDGARAKLGGQGSAYVEPRPKLQSSGVSQLQQAHVPNANQLESGSVADRTLSIAEQELGTVDPMKRGPDGNYQGWQHLQNIFEKTTGWRPTDKEIKASSQPQQKSWCGIFAAHVLQEAGANVRWDLTKGKMVGDVQHVLAPRYNGTTYKAERAAFENSIRPGDVITLSGKNNHHAIVTKVNPDGTVDTIDGNKPGIGRGKQKLSDVTTYYRPTGGGSAPQASATTGAAQVAPAASGSADAKAQEQLNDALGTRLAIDGKVGPKTTKAIELYQSMSGLPVTGKLDDVTRAALGKGAKPNGPLPEGVTVSGVPRRASTNPLDQTQAAEAAMAKNDARWKGVSVEDIAKNPDAFIANCAQVDGMSSTQDQTSCGPTSVMIGVVAGRPQAMVELAQKLVDGNGNPTDACKRLFPKIAGPDGKEYREVLKNIRTGTFRPIDVTVLSRGLYEDMLAKRPGGKPLGTTGEDLIALRSKLSSLGVSIPRMELQFYGPSMEPGMGHWQVGVGGKQYNPWPDANGKVGIVNDPQHSGIGLMKGRFGDNWANLEKIYIDDSTVHRQVYDFVAITSDGSEIVPDATNRNPPLVDVRMTRQPDGTFKVESFDAAELEKQGYPLANQAARDLYGKSVPI